LGKEGKNGKKLRRQRESVSARGNLGGRKRKEPLGGEERKKK